jgi:hypothetical protein
MKKTLLFLLLSLTIGSAWARVFGVSATLSGTNEAPPNGSTATGTVTGTYDDVSLLLNLTITFNGLAANASAAHIHKAAVGVNGPVIIPLSIPATTSGTFSYSGILTALQAADLMAGLHYVNIHNANFPGGEIREQLTVNQSIEIFNEVTKNAFYGIGGYSHTDGYIPDYGQKSPFVRSGPSPQNDFTYIATTLNGSDLYGSFGRLSTNNGNIAITLTFKGNNVRKLGLNVYEEDFSGNLTSGNINTTITTNLNNTATLTSTNGARFAGFRVLNQDEYIVSAIFSANSGFFTSLDNILFGDDNAQNVSLNFDGVNDYLEIPDDVADFAFNQNFTVTTWVKIPSANQPNTLNVDNDILEKWSLVDGYPFVIRYFNHTASAGNRFKINVGRWDGTNNPNIFSTINLNDDAWHHIAFVKNGSALTLYIDGVQNNTTTDNTTGITTNSSGLNVGRRGNNTNYFKGDIDEVRIWNIAKTATEIANERFCKTPNTTNLNGGYGFSEGSPNGNNTLITQVQNLTGSNHGTLTNFTKTGDASNFVTGLVKYVKSQLFISGNNSGSSWENAFSNLQSALTENTCNDLFDVYVAKGAASYTPHASDINASFNIPTGLKIYGGFAGTEKSINQRNMALIHSTYETTLSGDLSGNDILSDFTQNRSDNSKGVINIGNKSNIILDGFSIRGGNGGSGLGGFGGGINAFGSNGITINRVKIFDNQANLGGAILGIDVSNLKITNSSFLGNKSNFANGGDALYIEGSGLNKSISLNNCVVAGHIGYAAIYAGSNGQFSPSSLTHIYTNCTFANNNRVFNNVSVANDRTNNFTFKNSIVYGNANNNVNNANGFTQTITNSLVQGETSTANGNLVGTTNPQFVNPVYSIPTNAGDYRLKWCSLAIGAGTNTGISPLDLDRNPRNFNGTADMGAYEFLGNTPSQVNLSNITGTIDVPVYAGGAMQTITSTAKILTPAGAIDFKAPNSIMLNPGFEARGMSSYFKAQIGANVACVN